MFGHFLLIEIFLHAFTHFIWIFGKRFRKGVKVNNKIQSLFR